MRILLIIYVLFMSFFVYFIKEITGASLAVNMWLSIASASCLQQILIIAIELPRQVITQHKTASRPIFAFANIMWNDRLHLTTMCSRSLFLHQRCHRDVTAMASWDAYDVRRYLSYLFLCFHPLHTSENGELKTK